ncbi:thymidine kinase [Aquipuribacter nitratireducens]|uniref:Thymidine kinase n=1 Tax=Aquipuribacter nitratireducens TaxID=650104 RepID=A0ABW0GJ03_9MICO
MAELVFFCGTMDSGKSTLALQVDHTRAARGLQGMLFSRRDRAGEGRVSSRLGLDRPAREVADGTDLWQVVVDARLAGRRVDYLVCDEAQFYTAEQVDQLARVVDELGVDVFAFGITSDFRAQLFPGSKRLVELADRVEVLQVAALCWCGRRGTHNARTVDGRMVVDGAQVVVGDVSTDGDRSVIAYEVLCRRHFMRRMTAAAAGAGTLSPDVLPWAAEEAGSCPIDPGAQLVAQAEAERRRREQEAERRAATLWEGYPAAPRAGG